MNRNLAVQRKLTEIATFLPTAAEQFCRLSFWLVVGKYLSISQRLSYTL
jgi:hypothetical protein